MLGRNQHFGHSRQGCPFAKQFCPSLPLHPAPRVSLSSGCLKAQFFQIAQGILPVISKKPGRGSKMDQLGHQVRTRSYCGWTKSISHHLKPWLKPLLVGSCRGIMRNQGLLGGAKRISQRSTVAGQKIEASSRKPVGRPFAVECIA